MMCWGRHDFLQPAADCLPGVADVPRKWRDKESHTMRLVTITVLSIIRLR